MLDAVLTNLNAHITLWSLMRGGGRLWCPFLRIVTSVS